MALISDFIFTFISWLLLLTAVSGQDSNDTKAFRVGDPAILPCTGVPYDGVTQHWEKNPVIPIKYLVAIQTPLGQSSPGAPVYNADNIRAAGLTDRFTVTDDLMTATITDVRETDDGDYRCASGPSQIIHKLVAYKMNSVGIQPSGPATGNVGGTFDVTCTADSKPAASFNWTKQGDSSFTATGATLRISNLNMNDSGTYQCTSYHAYDSRTATVQLTVNEEPATTPTSQGRTGGSNIGTNSPQTGGLSTGAQAGIGIGVALGCIALAGVLAYFFVVKRKRAGRDKDDGVESGGEDFALQTPPGGHPGAPENLSRPPPNEPEVMYAELDLKNAPAGSRRPYVATPDDSPTEYAQIRPDKPPRSSVPHTLGPDNKTEYASISRQKPGRRDDLQAV